MDTAPAPRRPSRGVIAAVAASIALALGGLGAAAAFAGDDGEPAQDGGTTLVQETAPARATHRTHLVPAYVLPTDPVIAVPGDPLMADPWGDCPEDRGAPDDGGAPGDGGQTPDDGGRDDPGAGEPSIDSAF